MASSPRGRDRTPLIEDVRDDQLSSVVYGPARASEEIDVTDNPELREKMVEMAGGRRTVPEVFINGQIIGGYDELRALERAGKLDALLSA